ncbi:MAG: DUF2723 domain-containing protein [Bacteroidales bacterium]|nr:DUF2723 domain-containing protein [Bacteroidales bacterium]
MKQLRLVNLIAGWLIFGIAAFVYLSTIEPTASFWDCGEFISSSFKLEVGHPPGAPFFMIMGRFFTLFAGNDITKVATMVNVMSALASAFTILFLFWTITHLGGKILIKDGECSNTNIIAIIGSGIVGALAYTFSDTFWFSAVEAEVYATSSLFTALVFWAILKWENISDSSHSNRWLIFIGYLMGLSIGVHLLNLLAIPAIVLVFYFKHHEVNRRGVLKALLVSALILGSIIYIIMPGVVKLATFFELMFVNTFGLPYNSGILFYAIALISLIVWGLYTTYKRKKVILNTVILVITVILIGYSSYAVIVIRSVADPPMDQNDPEDLFSLLYYLNREQYGNRPLLYGQYFNALVTGSKEGSPFYYKENGRYIKNNFRIKYEYDDAYLTLFPRMWSDDDAQGHIDAYIYWAKLNERDLYQPQTDAGENVVTDSEGNIVYDRDKPRKSPGFFENLRFFWRYQLGHMYFRYFMWNFAGRQNDIQSHYKSDIDKGNWISGINFIDELRLGNQKQLPERMVQNKARNRYYFLPLLLGIAGLVYQYKKHRKDFIVTLVLFIMTGIAIVVYLNQNPLQPRERDYAYAGSFYAFAIWIGLGVLSLYEALKKFLPALAGGGLAILVTLVAVPIQMAGQNWDDHDRSGRYVARDFAYNYLNSCDTNAIIFTNGDNDTFPLWYAQEVEGIRTDVRVINLSYLGADWYIEQMQHKVYESDPVPFSLTKEQYRSGNRDIVYVVNRIDAYADLAEAIEFVASDDPRTKQLPEYQAEVAHFPTRKFIIPVDTSLVRRNGTVSPDDTSEILTEIRWEFESGRNYVMKNHLMVLDLLAHNNWERPIYYAITVSRDNYLNLEKHFEMRGLAYRIVPKEFEGSIFGDNGVNTDIMYDKMVNVFRWGGIHNPNVYLDENTLRMLGNFRSSFAQLALELIKENKPDSARQTLEKCLEVIPDKIVPYNVYNVLIADAFYQLGDIETANEIAFGIRDNVYKDMNYFISLGTRYLDYLIYEKQIAFYTLNELRNLALTNGQADLAAELREKMEIYASGLNIAF